LVKLSSRGLLDTLRRFKIAGDTNVPRQIGVIKNTHPSPSNTLITFSFLHQQFYLLFDEDLGDDVDKILSQIKHNKGSLDGQLIKNPSVDSIAYGLPFQGKTCYLFKAISSKVRLDSELANRYPETSRSTWQKYIEAGYVSVNGEIEKSVKKTVANIDSIAIQIPAATDFSGSKLPIVYLDDYVVVVDKPAGVLSHTKGALNDEFTVADFFRGYTTDNLDSNRPGIVHRLDRDTSGVMIGARDAQTAAYLQKQFAERKTKKTYLAILEGIPKLATARIDLPIARNPLKPSQFRVDTKGKSAITQYEVLATKDNYALVKLQPKTGRTHQLRVHMRYIGTPILGDRVYGHPSKRLYLHAQSLEVTLPNGERHVFTASIPSEFFEIFPEIKLS
jgi:23S rRNA pseudouridine1911/1915/1917 synthase